MKKIMDYFRGTCRLCIQGCEPERCMQRLTEAGIAFWQIEKTDEFTLSFLLYESAASRAAALCRRCQCDTELKLCPSFSRDFGGLKKRWALLLGLCAVAAAMLILPNYIFLFDVEGCAQIQEEELLRVLAEEGVRFGTYGQSVDNSQLRNTVLQRLPALRWIAVNQSGMRATVLVAERSVSEPLLDRRDRVTNLVSCADGVITQVNVLNGQALCRVGDAVTQGELLVSGLVDVERIVVPTRALGEVFAETRRQISVITPQKRLRRVPTDREGCCIYLCVGRKRIKICGSSGIYQGDCVKIVRRKQWTLPGGYDLPLSLCTEIYYHAEVQDTAISEADAKALLNDYVNRTIQQELVAGEILSARGALQASQGCYTMTETLHCREMIARSTEIPILELEQDGTNDQRRTDGTAD